MNGTGYLQDVTENGFSVFVPFSDTDWIQKHMINEFEVRIDDGRTISSDQRRKTFALIHDITEFVSAPMPAARKRENVEMLRQMQLLYLIDRTDSEAVRRRLTYHFCELSQIDLFSLSDVDMTTAREFIDYLVELCVVHGIPCEDTLLNRCEDIGRYLYSCVANRRCCICGTRADIHHVDHVGLRDRHKIHNLGLRVQPLCREHHNEVGTIGQKSFDDKYHTESIALDEHLCDILKWRK
ncbi:MAG: hypothetical protein LBN00_06510 [Oscillospiraceae bacterium]|jgi:hypothetical protein|nr:hypothetical protein [Oscillospiraceae bacterium]